MIHCNYWTKQVDQKLPAKPLELDSLSESELNAELDLGYADYVEGRVVTADRVAENIQRDYNI